jgi:hypothetical protein
MDLKAFSHYNKETFKHLSDLKSFKLYFLKVAKWLNKCSLYKARLGNSYIYSATNSAILL